LYFSYSWLGVQITWSKGMGRAYRHGRRTALAYENLTDA
jgi:hypothetical protein